MVFCICISYKWEPSRKLHVFILTFVYKPKQQIIKCIWLYVPLIKKKIKFFFCLLKLQVITPVRMGQGYGYEPSPKWQANIYDTPPARPQGVCKEIHEQAEIQNLKSIDLLIQY